MLAKPTRGQPGVSHWSVMAVRNRDKILRQPSQQPPSPLRLSRITAAGVLVRCALYRESRERHGRMQGINRLGKAPPRPGSLRAPDRNRNLTLVQYSGKDEEDILKDKDYQRTVRDVRPISTCRHSILASVHCATARDPQNASDSSLLRCRSRMLRSSRAGCSVEAVRALKLSCPTRGQPCAHFACSEHPCFDVMRCD